MLHVSSSGASPMTHQKSLQYIKIGLVVGFGVVWLVVFYVEFLWLVHLKPLTSMNCKHYLEERHECFCHVNVDIYHECLYMVQVEHPPCRVPFGSYTENH